MRDYPNIEKSGFHPGQYVGYGAGKVWRIKRVDHVKLWRATADGCNAIEARTLGDMSKMLPAS